LKETLNRFFYFALTINAVDAYYVKSVYGTKIFIFYVSVNVGR